MQNKDNHLLSKIRKTKPNPTLCMASLLPQAKSNENENKESKEFFNFGEMRP